VDVTLFTQPLNNVSNGCISIFLKYRNNIGPMQVSCMRNFLDSFLGGMGELRHIDFFNDVQHFLHRKFGQLRYLLQGFLNDSDKFLNIFFFENLFFRRAQVRLVVLGIRHDMHPSL